MNDNSTTNTPHNVITIMIHTVQTVDITFENTISLSIADAFFCNVLQLYVYVMKIASFFEVHSKGNATYSHSG